MDVATGSRLLGVLALGALVLVAAAAALSALALVVPAARRALAAVRAALAGQGLGLAWLVATVATAGSLWLSEGAGFPPCRLCWYQRGAMYPLVAVLGLAARGRALRIRPLVLVVVALGATVSTWHVLIERYPSLESSTGCDLTNPCSIRWIEEFGFLTIPTMALLAFALIATVLLLDPGPPPRAAADEAEPAIPVPVEEPA